MAEYTIIRKDNILDLRQAVNENIAKGFRPTGGISVLMTRFNEHLEYSERFKEGVLYYQAMYKE